MEMYFASSGWLAVQTTHDVFVCGAETSPVTNLLH